MEYISDSYLILSILVVVAFITGFVDSIAGGGGFISVPALMLAGLPTQQAVATNKLPAVFGSAIASYNFIKEGKILWRFAILGIIFALLGGVVGSSINLNVSKETLDKIVLIILPIAAIITFIPRKKIRAEQREFTKFETYVVVPVISFVLGIYDGFFGPGMGTFLIVAFYSILGLDMVNASGIAKLVNFSSGFSSLLVFMKMGTVVYTVGIPMLFSITLGGYIGSKIALKKGQSFIKLIMIIVFVIMFGTLMYKSFFK